MSYICLHRLDSGFLTKEDAEKWIAKLPENEQHLWRVLSLAEDDTISRLVAAQHAKDIDAAYARGAEMARKLLRLQLGLAVPGDRA